MTGAFLLRTWPRHKTQHLPDVCGRESSQRFSAMTEAFSLRIILAKNFKQSLLSGWVWLGLSCLGTTGWVKRCERSVAGSDPVSDTKQQTTN